MAKLLSELLATNLCVIYNELSPFTPYYMIPPMNHIYNIDQELMFHKKNIILLSLTFQKIIVNIDNLLAFSNYYSKEVVTRVVTSDWFERFVQAKIIVLAGWGTNINDDMLANQVDYSSRYKKHLKEKKYIDYLRGITSSSEFVVREVSMGEKDQINYFKPKLDLADSIYLKKELEQLTDTVLYNQDRYGFIGSMELYPYFEDKFRHDKQKLGYLYTAFYQSVQEYSNDYYQPAITVDTDRTLFPPMLIKRSKAENGRVLLNTIYQPEFFYRFLCNNFDSKRLDALFFVSPEKILAIRNGDWKVFLLKYHNCLSKASSLPWVIKTLRLSDTVTDKEIVDEILREVFDYLNKSEDLLSAVEIFDQFVGLVLGINVLKPITKIFLRKIKRLFGNVKPRKSLKEFDPFFIKLRNLLEGNATVQLAL
jgi:hypothetical protein